MDPHEACKILGIDEGHHPVLTAEIIRRHFLKRSLETHPDKNVRDEHAGEKFALLRQAYESLLEKVTEHAAIQEEATRTARILELLSRALEGEDVSHELRGLGIHRPSEMFGIDLTVRFDHRLPQWVKEGGSNEGSEDVGQVLKEAFRDEGLDDEGNPLDGWARPPTVDLEDL